MVHLSDNLNENEKKLLVLQFNQLMRMMIEFMIISVRRGICSLPVRKGHVERMRESADDENGQFESEQRCLLREDAPTDQEV